MATLIKLLAINIVDSNFCGFSKRDSIIVMSLKSSSLAASICFRVSEKKATSAPDIMAELISKRMSNTNESIEKINSPECITKRISGGSVSTFIS